MTATARSPSTGTAATAADATGLHKAADRRYAAVARSVRDTMVLGLVAAAPFASGATHAAIKGTVSDHGRRYVITLVAPTPQAVFTNTGTRAHVIRPRSKRALAFTAGGVRVVVAKVNHPGTPATHWWDRQLTPATFRDAVRMALARAS